jgi:hypothetical protein
MRRWIAFIPLSGIVLGVSTILVLAVSCSDGGFKSRDLGGPYLIEKLKDFQFYQDNRLSLSRVANPIRPARQ